MAITTNGGGCGSCGSRAGARNVSLRRILPSAQRPKSNSAALQAGAAKTYEVITGRGASTHRRFSSYVAAEGYAKRIGGSVRPV